jgi:flagellar protein FlaG
MSFEIGNLPPVHPTLATWRPESKRFSLDAAVAARASAPAGVDTVELSLPASPPPAVLDEIGAAADRAHELASLNRELHFHKDENSGRVIVEVRDLDGNVIRTIPPSEALNVLAGESL